MPSGLLLGNWRKPWTPTCTKNEMLHNLKCWEPIRACIAEFITRICTPAWILKLGKNSDASKMPSQADWESYKKISASCKWCHLQLLTFLFKVIIKFSTDCPRICAGSSRVPLSFHIFSVPVGLLLYLTSLQTIKEFRQMYDKS